MLKSQTNAWKGWLKGTLREWLLLARHYTIGFSGQGRTSLIMMFDGYVNHGGFVDRLKGIISFYELAQMRGWNFKIYFQSPFQLSLYLKENESAWVENAVRRRFPAARPVHFFDQPASYFGRLIRRFHVKCDFHVYSNIDFLAQLHPGHSRAQIDRLWGERFRQLFRLSEQLEKDVQTFLENSQNPIGLHFRFTNLLGDFTDTPRHVLDRESQDAMVASCLQQIDKLQKHNQPRTFFLFTDSHVFAALAVSRYPFLRSTPGVPLHTDLDGKDEGHQHYKTLLDFFLLSRMSEIYSIRTKRMYRSSFSRYASRVGYSVFHQVDI